MTKETCMALLKTCAKKRDLHRGTRVHADILKMGLLDKSSYVANALVSMYAKCGALAKAKEMLLAFAHWDVISWNALITGYVQHGQGENALNCFEQMQQDGISPTAVSFIGILKACGDMGAADKGEGIHDEIVRRGLLGNDVVLGTALVDMYAKCGALVKARKVLDELLFQDVISWNALIAGYAQHGQGHDALKCFEQMQDKGLTPNEVTFTCILKACGNTGATEKGEQIHDEIAKQGLLKTNVVLGTALVDMYAKCGALAKAKQLLEDLPTRNVISWNALIAGYAQQGQGQDALDCFEQMRNEGLSPNTVTFICTLKACGSVRAVEKGEQIHDELVRKGLLGNDIVLGNALVDMYAKCGALTKARQVLEELPYGNAVSWNALIAGYIQQGLDHDALSCFEWMQLKGLSPDKVTFTCILKACGNVGASDKGKQIHNEIARQGLLGKDIVLGTALVDMYVKSGALAKARQVLDEFSVRDVVCWSAIIAGYAQQGLGEEALNCYNQMQREGLYPDKVTFTCILKACGNVGAFDTGKKIHDEISKQGLLGSNVVLGTALVDMYAKCGALVKAQQVLKELPVRSVVSWNALISGYVQQGQGQDALNCFEGMKHEGLVPNEVTFICILKACGGMGAAEKGEKIHNELARQGLLGQNTALDNALVDMYAKCGALAKARQVLQELPFGNVTSWNALIAGYTQQGQALHALNCYEQMLGEGLFPDEVTFTCILKACSSIGIAEKGEQIHDEIAKQGILKNNTVLGNALIDMYAKCGAVAKARQVIEELPVRDVISWNTLIAGYGQQGQGQDALKCFDRMQGKGLSPDAATLSCVLNACSHSGLVDEGQMYFANLSTIQGITPDLEHYTCMVDLFGRAGHFDKAVAVIHRMPSSDYPIVWSALLGACQKWGDVSVGRWAFEHAVQLDRNDATAYVSMASICTAAGMHEDAEIGALI